MILNAGRFAILTGLLLLAACGGGGVSPTTASPQAVTPTPTEGRPVTQSDTEIATLLYNDTQRTPSGFYTDSAPSFNGYVSTAHLKAPDVGLGARAYELCTDDWNQALQWSDSAAASGSSQDALTGNAETALYFEFQRLRNGQPQGYIRQRVFKCAFVNRDDVDLTQTDGPAGRLNANPQAGSLQQLSEYLWTFTSFNNTGNAVLRSVSGASTGTLTQTLYIATLSAGANGACDTIQVLAWRHSLQVDNGAVTRSLQPLWSFTAQQQSGSVSLCAG